ncbi:unnamed protein product [Haemonchus placei]|uniref:Ovule protein n=1 Tax=Haemonchus placei TaxID=6290 RepID=A0A0N4WUN3_HAEPC|nr:unnamed protein product [Haemonchus placei]
MRDVKLEHDRSSTVDINYSHQSIGNSEPEEVSRFKYIVYNYLYKHIELPNLTCRFFIFPIFRASLFGA